MVTILVTKFCQCWLVYELYNATLMAPETLFNHTFYSPKSL